MQELSFAVLVLDSYYCDVYFENFIGQSRHTVTQTWVFVMIN